MATRGRVPKTSVTSRNIREVADIDRNLGQGTVTSDQLFQDNNVSGNYIDPVYCEGSTPEERKVIFQDKPLHSGEWRNYGGEEIIPEPGEPEIYFSSIIGTPFDGGQNIELAPQTPESQAYLKDNNLIIGIAVPPKINEVDKYTSALVTDSKQLVDLTQSAMLREGNDNVLNDSNLAVRVGLDYLDGPATKDATFSYNITVYYGDIPIEFSVREGSEFWAKVKGLFVPKFTNGTQSVEAIANGFNLQHLFDYLIGGKTPVMEKVNKSVDKIFESAGTTGAGIILQAVALYTTMILVADTIWNFFLSPTKATDGIYQYKNLIEGMYAWDDIKKTKYQLGFGSVFAGEDNFTSKLISKTKDQNIYTSPANNTLFPANDAQGRFNYANFKFFPKCVQYDLMTPPAVITFKVELEAISGCHLSQTKPTAFVISIAPDRYSVPLFDVITPSGRASQGIKNVFINSPLVFQNARFVDFIALLDTQKDSGFLGLFPTYENRYINSDGDQGEFKNKHLPIPGDNITTEGGIAFGGVGYPSGTPLITLYPAPSLYDCKFMQEAQGNLLRNPTFRLEQLSSDPANETYLLKKFWNYDASWVIRDGAIYRDSASVFVSGLWQSVPALKAEIHTSRPKYYMFEIECTVDSGYLAVDLLGTFRGGICNWLSSDSYYNHKKYIRPFLLSQDYPDGMTYDGSSGQALLKINAGTPNEIRRYKVLLRVATPTAKIFKMVPSIDYTGRINYISLQHMPAFAIDDKARGCVNALVEYNQPKLQLQWMDAIITTKTVTFTYNISDPATATIKFTPDAIEFASYTVSIDWGDGTDTLTDLTYQEYTLTHNYTQPGIYTVVLTNTIPQSNLDNTFDTLTCNDPQLVKFHDDGGLLYEGSVDLSDSSIGIASAMPMLLYMGAESFTTPLSSLDISNTPITGDCDNFTVVSDYLDISNTPITGDLSSLFNIAYVNASNTGVTTSFASDQPTGDDGNKTIIWKDTGMDVYQLYNLIHSIDLSNIEEGYLDIKGDNPAIYDQGVLDTITMLTTILGEPDGLGGIGRGWEILFNTGSKILTVVNGTGSGEYAIGSEIVIAATVPSGYYFSQWTGDTSYITTGLVTDESVTITMPNSDITLTATFLPYLTLTVNNGTIS